VKFREVNAKYRPRISSRRAKWLKARPPQRQTPAANRILLFWGGIVNQLAVLLSKALNSGAPFYGRQPSAEDGGQDHCARMLQYATRHRPVVGGRHSRRRYPRSRPTTRPTRNSMYKAAHGLSQLTLRRATTKAAASARMAADPGFLSTRTSADLSLSSATSVPATVPRCTRHEGTKNSCTEVSFVFVSRC